LNVFKKISLFLLLIEAGLFFLFLPARAEDTLRLSTKVRSVLLDSAYLVPTDSSFSPIPSTSKFLYNRDPEQSAYARVLIYNPSDTPRTLIFLSHFYALDELDLQVLSGQEIKSFVFRDTTSIYQRSIRHKHPSFSIQLPASSLSALHIRVKNESAFEYAFELFDPEEFYSAYFIEYLIFGLFYGFLLFVVFYCFINFFFFKDPLVLVYLFCIASQAVHMLFRDGNGLYIFPDSPEHADLIKNISRTFMSVSLMLYTGLFLKIPVRNWKFYALLVLMVGRIGYGIFMLGDTIKFTFHVEFLIILFCTLLGFLSYNRVDKEARYLAIGLGILSTVYMLYYFAIMGFIHIDGAIVFWSLYVGIAFENIFFTLAITERFKRIRVEQFRQQQMNKELEQLVDQRTKTVQLQNNLLEAQSNELNLFLYSASHDLKGPLKSIEGLCNVALMDPEADYPKLFEMIKSRLKRLELNIADLNAVTKLKYYQDGLKQLDFYQLHQEITERFENYPGYREMLIKLQVKSYKSYRLDAFAFRCIYQNIVENAIKYRDTSKRSFLFIQIEEKNGMLTINFEDNGKGIAKDHLSKIFNMFYRASEESREDTGLGLYIVKLAAEKMGGSIHVSSTLAEGTVFTLRIPATP
jgi:hypothetical protein